MSRKKYGKFEGGSYRPLLDLQWLITLAPWENHRNQNMYPLGVHPSDLQGLSTLAPSENHRNQNPDVFRIS